MVARLRWAEGNKKTAERDASAVKGIPLGGSAVPSQSDASMRDVEHLTGGVPTVIGQRIKYSVLKVRNNTQKTQKSVKKLSNGDIDMSEIIDFNSCHRVLKRNLALQYHGQGSYAVYDTGNGLLAFGFNNHNAFGDNFIQDNADKNVSVYVAEKEFLHPDSDVEYTEYRYSVEDFNAHKQEIFKNLVESVGVALEGKEFPDLKYAKKAVYPLGKEEEAEFFSDEPEAGTESDRNVRLSRDDRRGTERTLTAMANRLRVDGALDWRDYVLTEVGSGMKFTTDDNGNSRSIVSHVTGRRSDIPLFMLDKNAGRSAADRERLKYYKSLGYDSEEACVVTPAAKND